MLGDAAAPSTSTCNHAGLSLPPLLNLISILIYNLLNVEKRVKHVNNRHIVLASEL